MGSCVGNEARMVEQRGVCVRETLVDRSEEAFSGRICMEDVVW
jgi:hypothetical protein